MADQNNSNDELGRVLTTAQAAEILHCGEEHIRYLCRTLQLPAFRLGAGGKYRINERDMTRYRQQLVAGEPQPPAIPGPAKSKRRGRPRKSDTTSPE